MASGKKRKSGAGQGAPKPGKRPVKRPGSSTSASGGSQRGPTRAQRIAALQEAQRRRARNRKLLVAGGIALTVLVIVGVVVNNQRETSRRIERLEAGGCMYDNRADSDDGQGRNHVASVTYEVDPPAGGNHFASPASPGIYSAANLPPDGRLVHSLEHGDIILWHQVDIDSSTLGGLEDIANRYPDDVLVVPRLTLEVPVAATAWHDRLLCPSADFAALDLFVRTWRDEGPETVPE